MLQSSIAMLIGTGLVGFSAYKRFYWLAATIGMVTLYLCMFQMVIWLAGQNSSDHSYYAKLVICRMTDKTGTCP